MRETLHRTSIMTGNLGGGVPPVDRSQFGRKRRSDKRHDHRYQQKINRLVSRWHGSHEIKAAQDWDKLANYVNTEVAYNGEIVGLRSSVRVGALSV